MLSFIARHTSFIIIVSLLFFITFGSLVFMLPGMLYCSCSYVNALLLSISSFCTVGVLPVPFSDLTQYGKFFLLFLIQVGGIGISAFFMLAVSMFVHSSVEWNSVAKDFYEIIERKLFKKFFIISLFYMIIIEFVFAYLFYWLVIPQETFFNAFFFIADCFCNAGFSGSDPVIMSYSHNPLFFIFGSAAMFLGGMGFLFIFEFYNKLYPSFIGRINTNFSFTIRFGALVYIATALIAWICFFLFCSDTYSIFEISRSLFAAISFRACGINPYINYSPLFILLVSSYSFCGTLPFATGGGLKTSIIGIFFITLYSLINNVRTVIIFGKQILTIYLLQAHLYMMYLFIMCSVSSIVIFKIVDYAYEFSFIWCYVSTLFTGTGISWFEPDFTTGVQIIFIITIFIGKISGILLHMRLLSAPKTVSQRPEAKIIMF